jgi:HAD superfamily hydrolase (TIGR01662 family)
VSDDALAAVLARTSHVLLDFDGPVCSVFSSFTPAAVAKELRSRLGLVGLLETNEPFDVLEYVARHDPSAAGEAETELTRLETDAVATAAATPGAGDMLRNFADAGRAVVVVSNNSAAAVRAYLAQRGLVPYVAGVSARCEPDPALLKPNPYLLDRAIDSLATTPEACVMIGDSISDIEAARTAGSPVIAFANKPGKFSRFKECNPDAIIINLSEIPSNATPLGSK